MNNIAWALRRLPVFGVFGDGRYRLQPTYVDDAPAGATKLTDWARERASSLGRRYTSELARRRDRRAAYGSH